ncbi:hypothetical protein BH24ACT3_BH24ACT3_11460 [soil metagenome]
MTRHYHLDLSPGLPLPGCDDGNDRYSKGRRYLAEGRLIPGRDDTPTRGDPLRRHEVSSQLSAACTHIGFPLSPGGSVGYLPPAA